MAVTSDTELYVTITGKSYDAISYQPLINDLGGSRVSYDLKGAIKEYKNINITADGSTTDKTLLAKITKDTGVFQNIETKISKFSFFPRIRTLSHKISEQLSTEGIEQISPSVLTNMLKARDKMIWEGADGNLGYFRVAGSLGNNYEIKASSEIPAGSSFDALKSLIGTQWRQLKGIGASQAICLVYGANTQSAFERTITNTDRTALSGLKEAYPMIKFVEVTSIVDSTNEGFLMYNPENVKIAEVGGYEDPFIYGADKMTKSTTTYFDMGNSAVNFGEGSYCYQQPLTFA